MHPTQNTVADQATTPASVLRAAAGYLLHFGWYQGDLFDLDALVAAEDYDRATPSACALGGIHMAVLGTPALDRWQPGQAERFDAAVATLADHLILAYQVAGPDAAEVLAEDSPSGLWQVVSGWNDDGERNASQVIAALYGAADEWERLHPTGGGDA